MHMLFNKRRKLNMIRQCLELSLLAFQSSVQNIDNDSVQQTDFQIRIPFIQSNIHKSLMIQCQVQKIAFHRKKSRKVVSIVPLSHNGFLLEEVDPSKCLNRCFTGKCDRYLMHIDEKGQIIWQHPLYAQGHHARVINSEEAIIWRQLGKAIDVLSLTTHQLLNVKCCQNNSKIAFKLISVQMFEETQNICLCSIQQKRKILRINYYSGSNAQKFAKPIAEWESKQRQIAAYSDLRKVNNRSKIAWWIFQFQQKSNVLFFFCQLNGNCQCQISTVKAYVSEGIGCLRMQVLWQLEDKVFLVTSKSERKAQTGPNKTETILQNFILDSTKEGLPGSITKSNFTFEGKSLSLPFGKSIDISGEKVLAIQTLENQSKGNLTKTYYFDVEKRRITSFEKRHQNSKMIVSGKEKWVLRDRFSLEVDESDGLIIKQTRFIPFLSLRDICLHFLLHLNQDFDDDLLQDALELIQPQAPGH